MTFFGKCSPKEYGTTIYSRNYKNILRNQFYDLSRKYVLCTCYVPPSVQDFGDSNSKKKKNTMSVLKDLNI